MALVGEVTTGPVYGVMHASAESTLRSMDCMEPEMTRTWLSRHASTVSYSVSLYISKTVVHVVGVGDNGASHPWEAHSVVDNSTPAVRAVLGDALVTEVIDDVGGHVECGVSAVIEHIENELSRWEDSEQYNTAASAHE